MRAYRSRNPSRDKAIINDFHAGMTYEAIGQKHGGLSRERVRQIIVANGLTYFDGGIHARVLKAREETRAGVIQRRTARQALQAALAADIRAGLTYLGASLKYGVAMGEVGRILAKQGAIANPRSETAKRDQSVHRDFLTGVTKQELESRYGLKRPNLDRILKKQKGNQQ